MIYDVVIIGSGVVGGLAAYQMSKYDLKIAVLDSAAESATGASCANSGILHAGYDAEEGTLKARLNVLGNSLMDKICDELDVPIKRNGSLLIAFSKEQKKIIENLYNRGIANGVTGLDILNKKETLELEPEINPEIVAALYAPSAGIISPFELAIAAVETAALNGAELFFNCEVQSIIEEKNYITLNCSNNQIKTKYVINCAGVNADKLSGIEDFRITPRKGEYLLLDKKNSNIVSHTIFPCPTEKGKGILLAPTVHGNIILGPTSTYTSDREDVETSAAGIEAVVQQCMHYVPTLEVKGTITSFAGLRASSNKQDFLIDFAPNSTRQINAAGIDSPGLTASPAIALMLEQMLQKAGLALKPKPVFNQRERVIHMNELSLQQRNNIIKNNPAYGKIICRCEQISEGEIIDAIKRGATTVDGVKRRVRAGMGRCQGSFCLPSVIEILARELNISPEQVTKCGGKSIYITGTNR